MNKIGYKLKAKQFMFIALGVLIMDVGYYFFYSPANLVAGGVTGISIILKPVLDMINMPQSIFLYIIEAICLILGLILLGRDFFLKTVVASLLAPTYVLIFEQICPQEVILNTVTQNKLIVAFLCGSILQGVGIGICLKNNGSTGGLDVIQKSISKYLHIPYSFAMFGTDWIICILSGFSFATPISYNFEYTLFGIISVYFAAYIIDVITLNARSRRTAYIITSKPEEVKEAIYKNIGRGCTESDVRGGYTNQDKVMLICVLNKTESYKLGEFIKSVDAEAFTFFTTTREVVGDYANKPKP